MPRGPGGEEKKCLLGPGRAPRMKCLVSSASLDCIGKPCGFSKPCSLRLRAKWPARDDSTALNGRLRDFLRLLPLHAKGGGTHAPEHNALPCEDLHCPGLHRPLFANRDPDRLIRTVAFAPGKSNVDLPFALTFRQKHPIDPRAHQGDREQIPLRNDTAAVQPDPLLPGAMLGDLHPVSPDPPRDIKPDHTARCQKVRSLYLLQRGEVQVEL